MSILGLVAAGLALALAYRRAAAAQSKRELRPDSAGDATSRARRR